MGKEALEFEQVYQEEIDKLSLPPGSTSVFAGRQLFCNFDS